MCLSANCRLFMASSEKVTFEEINKHMKADIPADIAKYQDCICTLNAFWHMKDSVLLLNIVQKDFKKSFALDGAGFPPKTIKHPLSLSLLNKKVHLCAHLLHIYITCTLYLHQYICLEAEGSLTFPKTFLIPSDLFDVSICLKSP